MKKERLRILVVDDDRRMVRTVGDILKINGYEAICAYTGEEAVESVRSEAPDCVLMDIRMPGIDGVEACRRIHGISPDLPIILVSAYATEEAEAEGRKYGVSAVLTKPLLDLNLGEVSGLDVLREIRAKYPSKPVVLVTGYREEMTDSIKKGLEIGAYACLYKPLEVERLVALIEEVSRNKARSILEREEQ